MCDMCSEPRGVAAPPPPPAAAAAASAAFLSQPSGSGAGVADDDVDDAMLQSILNDSMTIPAPGTADANADGDPGVEDLSAAVWPWNSN